MATQPTVQISIHASAKEATLDEQKPFKVVLYISIHASAKEATFPLYLLWMGKRFQSTPPRRRRRKPVRCRKPMHCHFNPRLREGGDFSSLSSVDGETISIHASAKEATFHSLKWRINTTDFNPRLREGGDTHSNCYNRCYNISIHASAKEATATYCDTSAIMYISSLNNFFVHFF